MSKFSSESSANQKIHLKSVKTMTQGSQSLHDTPKRVILKPYRKEQSLLPPIWARESPNKRQIVNSSDLCRSKSKRRSPKSSQQLQIQQKEQENNNNQYKQVIQLIRKTKTYYKGEERISQLSEVLKFNGFFRKIGNFLTSLLLKIGKIIYLDRGEVLYSKDMPIRSLYIVISGKLHLKNPYKGFKKYVIVGETLSEQILFEFDSDYRKRIGVHQTIQHSEDCFCLYTASLLKVSPDKYYQMAVSMINNGYKNQFKCLDNIMRVNYINKNSLRRNRMESPTMRKKSMPSSGFTKY